MRITSSSNGLRNVGTFCAKKRTKVANITSPFSWALREGEVIQLARIFLTYFVLITGAYGMELPGDVYSEIVTLSEKANALAEKSQYREAAIKFIEAYELLPEPVEDWEACTWLLASIGDMNFMLGAYEQARSALSDAMRCPGAIGNPFIHLRLGQVQLELGNKDRAADELARAYMGGGSEIFDEDDPKYFEFLKTVLEPPASGQW